MTPGEFAAFLDALKRGDSKAWEDLFESFDETIRWRVRACIRGLGLQNEVDSLDALHSALIAVLRKKVLEQYRFDTIVGLRTLILAATLNRLRNRAGRRRAQPLGAIDVATGAPSPSEQLMKEEQENEQRDQLEEFLTRLPDQDRQIFTWKEVEGRSWQEIAQLLGRNPQTIHALQTQYRRHIRQVLDELGFSNE